jgi:hypothetical protein
VSVKKLTMGGEQTAEQVVGYLADPQATGDYYSEAGRAFMRWLATPRSRTFFALGQPGTEVSRWKLTPLIEGRDPLTGELIRRYGPDGTMVGATDVTLSPAPKRVSVLWALADDPLRAELEDMVVTAVDWAIGRMLDDLPMVRERYGPGPNDVRRVRADDQVGVQVLHSTARLAAGASGAPDPQLHCSGRLS